MSINVRLKNSVARLVGQCNGIMKMHADGRKCADILVQLSAVASSINTCSKKIFDYHINECLTQDDDKAHELHELNDMLDTISTTKLEGSLDDAITHLNAALDGHSCIEILHEFRLAYAVVIYNAGKLFSHHLSHVLVNDNNGSAGEELKEMTNLYFKMLK